ncbi:hypothetical protein D9613_007699 [Agrocybe pediades]|uniref:DUF572-domain-containing protein n=1 Tax=Agrocybe pediades TaxID=84607 RepID=A0A8H4QNL0_9AGAR|nr:hypothetical protein D9613_007699 [Agrocybe pediades]KAF9554008.1 DUF572-domain-containing protein [Agrocybe pediades]
MQGFNKYYPPDYDPSQGSLNKLRGKHALGDRARKLDQGILITRFELPFNIWCETCNNHIGMGVRYNAEKKKIGAYYSTPIYSFRCKCHLCDGWFEIHTDPKNTRYVVVSGARQKDEDWNPEENGGYAIHDTEKEGAPVDPLAALEKTSEAKNHMENVQRPRIESLQDFSDRYNADPYSLSLKTRKRFREEKKIEQQKKRSDDLVKDRYGLPASLQLLEEDSASKSEAKAEWQKAQQDHLRESKRTKTVLRSTPIASSMPSRTSSRNSTKPEPSSIGSLRARILQNTAKRSATAHKS